jgi:fatty-acyl-CoA synthase
MPHTSFGYILRKKAKYFAEDVAIIDSGIDESFTYQELESRSNRIARSLQNRGVEKGDRVCSITRNMVEYFDLLFATSKLGAVLTPLNHRLAPEEIEYMITDADPKLVVYESLFTEGLADLSPNDWDFVVIGDTDDPFGDAEPFEGLLSADAAPMPLQAREREPAVMLYTSGSTGRPKGVPITHRNLFFTSVNWIVDMEITKSDVTFNPGPLFHAGGLCILNISSIHVGGKLVIQREFDPEETWKILADNGVHKFFIIPTMLNMMINVDDWQERFDLDNLELAIAGGEPIPSELKQALKQIDVPLIPGFGLTETTDGTLFLRPRDTYDKGPKVMGKTFTHNDARVVDEDNNPVEPGTRGEIVHRGPQIAAGYHNRPEATAETWDDEGWMHTGDIGAVDEDGYFSVLGRVDNMILSGGENIYPGEIEEHLYSHPAVEEVVVLGVPSDEWGQAVKAVVVTKGDADLDLEAVREYLDGRLAAFKHPKIVETAESFPKTGSGKISRVDVEDEHGQA